MVSVVYSMGVPVLNGRQLYTGRQKSLYLFTYSVLQVLVRFQEESRMWQILI
jgi:hypothetical protein